MAIWQPAVAQMLPGRSGSLPLSGGFNDAASPNGPPAPSTIIILPHPTTLAAMDNFLAFPDTPRPPPPLPTQDKAKLRGHKSLQSTPNAGGSHTPSATVDHPTVDHPTVSRGR